MDAVLSILSVLLSCGTALAFDRMSERAGLTPPNFRLDSEAPALARQRAAVLRSASMMLMALVFWLAVFAPLSVIGEAQTIDPSKLTITQLFFLHLVFVLCLGAWYTVGFAGSGALSTAWIDQFGFRAAAIPREIGIGVVAGVAGWLGVIAILLIVALGLYLVGGEEALPTQPPEMIGWVVALPVLVRVALSLSAGVVEETFFRGFLQPRVGIALSTVLFVLAHLSYEQPFLLIGVGLLSLLFAALVRWRQNIWAAAVAHSVFDGIQLLIVIPAALELLDSPAAGPLAQTLAWATTL